VSQLHQLIGACTGAERQLLRNLSLRGKEKEVFDLVFGHAGEELPANDSITAAVKVSETHLYKINSVLTRKCYECLVPEGGMHLLEYLAKKNLYVQLHHEISVLEKQLKAAKDPSLPAFYLSCFRLLIDAPFRYFDKKLSAAFGKKYLEAKKDRTLSDDLFVELQSFFAEVNRTAAQKDHAKQSARLLNRLRRYEKELEGTGHHLACYYLYRSFCSYYNYYEKNNAQVLAYLQKAMALRDKIRDCFPINVGQFLRLLYADALFQDGRTDTASGSYEEVFREGVDEGMYGYYYHCEQYVLTCIISGQLDKARTLLEKIFDPVIDRKQDIYATRGALAYAKLYITAGDYKKALGYINLGRSINEKTFYLPFDLQLRVLENLCFYFKGEYDFAHQLTLRNLKFLNSQKAESSLEDYKLLFRIISAFIKARESRKDLPERFTKDFERISAQYRNLYCDLIGNLER
jgi:hypothetical protein